MSASSWQIFVEVPGRAPIELALGEAVIGRSRACAVQVAETTVSRQHAVFVVEPGNVRLRDLGSSNGTYVNGKRVDGMQALSDGDRVVVGEAELVIRILPPLGPGEATQKLVLPPLSAPTPTHAEPASTFRRTPTPLPDAAPSIPIPMPASRPAPVAPMAPMAPMAQVAPAPPAPPLPRAPAFASPALPPLPAAPVVEAKKEPPRKVGDVLSSIQDIDLAPMPPPMARKAPALDKHQPAGFWIRVAAALLDSIPFLLLVVISLAITFFVSPQLALLVSLLQFAYGLLLTLVLPALKGTTPGKKILKLAIVSAQTAPGQGLGWNSALLRFVGHIVCSLTFGLGYLLVAFTAEKQGLHDLIAKTHVVRRK